MEAERSALGLRIGSGTDGRRRGSRGGGGRGWRKEESTPEGVEGTVGDTGRGMALSKRKGGTPNKFNRELYLD